MKRYPWKQRWAAWWVHTPWTFLLAIANVISGLWLHHTLTQQPPEFLPAGGPCFAVDMRLPGVVYPLGYALHCDPNRPIWELPYRATTAPPVTR